MRGEGHAWVLPVERRAGLGESPEWGREAVDAPEMGSAPGRGGERVGIGSFGCSWGFKA